MRRGRGFDAACAASSARGGAVDGGGGRGGASRRGERAVASPASTGTSKSTDAGTTSEAKATTASSVTGATDAVATAEESLSGTVLRLLARDLRIGLRSLWQWLNPLVFLLIIVSLFPLGVGPAPATLARIAPGVIWISALLTVLLSFDALFARDHADGTLEQLVLGEAPLSLVVLGKVLAHWALSALPLLALSPLLGVLLQLPLDALPALAASLALGTPTLSLVGAIGAALTVGVNRGGALLSLLVLPLTAPVLVFGAAAVTAAAEGRPIGAELSVLAAMLGAALALAPLATAAALRVTAGGDG